MKFDISIYHLIRFTIFLLFYIAYSSTIFSKELKVNKQKIENYFKSVVSIETRVSEDARTAQTLGLIRKGSGVVIDANNILTIGYIVLEAEKIIIRLHDNKSLPGKLIGYDYSSGFGIISPIIKIKLNSLSIGDSNKIGLDERLFILPSPQIGVGSITKLVSRRPFVGWWEYYLDNPIYTFPSNQSWAGAPLINKSGEILGIGSLYVPDAITPGIISPGNMFVPINLLKPILNDLKKYGRKKSNIQPYLGLSSEEKNGKIFVTSVNKNGPAYISGIKSGDYITSLNGKELKSLKHFYKTLWGSGDNGVEVSIGILRNNKKILIKVKTMDRMDYLVKRKSF